MDRFLVISSDCHAGLLPEAYREYLDPQYREAFDVVEVPNDILLRPVADGEPDAPDDTADRTQRIGTDVSPSK